MPATVTSSQAVESSRVGKSSRDELSEIQNEFQVYICDINGFERSKNELKLDVTSLADGPRKARHKEA